MLFPIGIDHGGNSGAGTYYYTWAKDLFGQSWGFLHFAVLDLFLIHIHWICEPQQYLGVSIAQCTAIQSLPCNGDYNLLFSDFVAATPEDPAEDLDDDTTEKLKSAVHAFLEKNIKVTP